MRLWLPFLGLCLFPTVSACSSIPVASIAPLMRLDLVATNVEALRVALQLPEGLRSRPGGVVMDLVLKLDGAPDVTEHFLLVETEGAADLAGLVPMQRPGFGLVAFRLAAADVPRFRAVQAAVLTARDNRRKGSLGFGIGAREFCLTGSSRPPRMLASSYLQTAESGGWLTVTDQFDLNSDKAIAAGLANLAPC